MKQECYEFIYGESGHLEIVGFGSYGQVKLARNTENGDVVAIKMIPSKNAKEEIDVHHKLNHPNIIKLLNYYYQKQKNITYMVLEYASGGTLNGKIKKGFGQLQKDTIKRWFRDVCQAVKYLHQNNYMHRDIKPQNILITRDNHAKLCDFGFASILEYRSTLCGTFQYMAPQMIQKKPYDYKIDIWALGILLFELIEGKAPFRGGTGQEVIAEMKKSLIFSSRFDNIEIDLIKKILRVNAQNRLEIVKILQHPYFKNDPEKKQIENKKQEKNQSNRFQFLKRGQKEKAQKDQKGHKDEKVHKDEKDKEKEEAKEVTNFRESNGIQLKKQELKKDDFKHDQRKQFKPFIPANLQRPNNTILNRPQFPKSPQQGYSQISPISPQQNQFIAQQQSSFNLNTSYQMPSTFTPVATSHNSSFSTNLPVWPTNSSLLNGGKTVGGQIGRPIPANNLPPQQFQSYGSWKKI